MTATGRLRGGAVDDSHKVSGHDDAVLASLAGAFGDEGLFEDCHGEKDGVYSARRGEV